MSATDEGDPIYSWALGIRMTRDLEALDIGTLSPGQLFATDTTTTRMAGALLGGAVADAMGWPTEFTRTKEQLLSRHGVEQISDFVSWEKRTGGRFNTYIDYLQPGEYSDDTQLTLCVARSLTADGRTDVERFAKAELPAWLDYARGAGATVTAAARSLTRRSTAWDNNFFTFGGRRGKTGYTDGGANGAAMRIAPIALANIHDPERCAKEVWRNAIVTHGHPRAIVGALTLSAAILALFDEQVEITSDTFINRLKSATSQISADSADDRIRDWIKRWNSATGASFERLLSEVSREMTNMLDIAFTVRDSEPRHVLDALGCYAPRTRGSGTATVAAAIALFYRFGGNYEQAVVRAVNLVGTDTDTIASMMGTLIGAYKGPDRIPERWVTRLQDYPYFLRAAEAITRIALRQATSNDLDVDHRRDEFDPSKDIVTLVRNRAVSTGQRVVHPILGLGWVDSAHSQQIKRRGAGTMLLARVKFDVGQSCVFRSYLSPKAR